jgi:hypothetical protein
MRPLIVMLGMLAVWAGAIVLLGLLAGTAWALLSWGWGLIW